MSYSLSTAQLAQALRGQQMEVLASGDLGDRHYAITVRGQWLGQFQVRHYVVYGQGQNWHAVQLPATWIRDAARAEQIALEQGKGQKHERG